MAATVGSAFTAFLDQQWTDSADHQPRIFRGSGFLYDLADQVDRFRALLLYVVQRHGPYVCLSCFSLEPYAPKLHPTVSVLVLGCP